MRFAPLLPVLLALSVHASILPGDFVFDDVLLVEEDPGLRAFDLRRIFLDNYWGHSRVDLNYRPVVLLSYALHHLAGGEAWTFHAANVLLAALVVYLAFRVLWELLGDRWLAALGASIFAVLPIHTEAVAGIVGWAELLAAAAVLGAWLLSFEPPGERGWRRPLLAATLVFLGLGSKESAVVVIPIAVASAVLLKRRIPWKALALSLVALAVYLAVRSAALHGSFELVETGSATLVTRTDNPLFDLPAFTRAVNGAALVGLYAWKTLVPVHLSADYSFDQLPARTLSDPVLWLSAAGVFLAAVLGTIALHRRAPVAALGFAFFPLAFLATANVLFPIGTVFGERLAYLPSLAVPLVACGVAAGWWRHPDAAGRRRIVTASLAAAIGIYAGRTVVRTLEWRDRATLYARTMESSPRSVRAQMLGASAFLIRAARAGSDGEAWTHLDAAEAAAARALAIDPGSGRARGKRGEVLLARGDRLWKEGRVAEARELYARAQADLAAAWEVLAANRQSEPALLGLRAMALMKLRKLREAKVEFAKHIALLERRGAPAPLSTWIGAANANLFLAQEALGAATPDAAGVETARSLLHEALRMLERASVLEPGDSEVYGLRGLARGMLASIEDGASSSSRNLLSLALEDFDRALELAGTDEKPKLYANRGYAKQLLGHARGGLEDYRAGLAVCRRQGRLHHPEEDCATRFLLRIAALAEALGDAEAARAASDEAAAIVENATRGPAGRAQ